MKKADILEFLINGLSMPLKKHGFVYEKKQNSFVWRDGVLSKDLTLRIFLNYVYYIDPGVGIRHETVEEIFHKTSGFPKDAQKLTSTLAWGSGNFPEKYKYAEFRLENESELPAALNWCLDIFQNVGLPIYSSITNLESIEELLNKNPHEFSTCSSNEWFRSARGVIVAQMLDRSNTNELARIYLERMAYLNKGFELPQYKALLKDLKIKV